jgi:hypothetical protein
MVGYHFERGEYKAAVTAARKLDLPGYFWTQIFLAGIYAELGRQNEARVALAELVNLYPSFNTQKLVEEWRKWNLPDDRIQLWVAALRKAGLPD